MSADPRIQMQEEEVREFFSGLMNLFSARVRSGDPTIATDDVKVHWENQFLSRRIK